MQYIYDRMGEHFHQRLNEFALTRRYNSIEGLIGYRDSEVPQFRNEANRGFQLRDGVWQVLLPYFQGVLTGVNPVPITLAEIDALVPPFTWGDEPEAPQEPETPEIPQDPEPSDPEEGTGEEGGEGGDPDPSPETPEDPAP